MKVVPKTSPNQYPRAKKSLGQNFLHAPNICSKIAHLVALAQTNNILEIGPGHGALTKHLLDLTPTKLVLLEKDNFLASELAPKLPPYAICVLTDALTFAWQRLDPSWVVVGNLPYNIASPLLFDLTAKAQMALGVFMVQKEVAERICAQPACKAYGALSIWIQTFGRPHMEFLVPPSCFHPKPKVDSAVISFQPKHDAPSKEYLPYLKRLVDICFQKRRKQLGNILGQAGLADLNQDLLDLGLNTKQRPEELEVKHFWQLAKCLARLEKTKDFAKSKSILE